MRYRSFGNTGLEVSYLSYGAAPLSCMYGDLSDDDAKYAVHMAIDSGINYFDVAPGYGPNGLAEERLGTALEGSRHKIILATKTGRYDTGAYQAPNYEFAYDKKTVRTEFEKSLRRLRTDYVDVLQVHDITNSRELSYILEETVPELEKLRDEGKIRFIGITSLYLDALKYVLDRSSSVDTVLNFCRYNLADTSLNGYFREDIEKRGLALVNASILFMGMLTCNNKTVVRVRKSEKFAALREAVQIACKLCEAEGTTLPEQAFLFGMEYREAATTLVGMGRPESVRRNLDMLDKSCDKNLCAKLQIILAGKSGFPDMGQAGGISLHPSPGAGSGT